MASKKMIRAPPFKPDQPQKERKHKKAGPKQRTEPRSPPTLHLDPQFDTTKGPCKSVSFSNQGTRIHSGGPIKKSGLFIHRIQDPQFLKTHFDSPPPPGLLSPLPLPKFPNKATPAPDPRPPHFLTNGNLAVPSPAREKSHDYLAHLLTKPNIGPRNTAVSPLNHVGETTPSSEINERNWEQEKLALAIEIQQEEDALKKSKKSVLLAKKSVTFNNGPPPQPGRTTHSSRSSSPEEILETRSMAPGLQCRLGLLKKANFLEKLQNSDFGQDGELKTLTSPMEFDHLYGPSPLAFKAEKEVKFISKSKGRKD